MILLDDIFVYINENMPPDVSGLVSPNPDGTYTILINGQLPREQQVDAFWHEVGHIKRNDFERVETYGVQLIESENQKDGGK